MHATCRHATTERSLFRPRNAPQGSWHDPFPSPVDTVANRAMDDFVPLGHSALLPRRTNTDAAASAKQELARDGKAAAGIRFFD